jgi:hypothetical protein
VSARATPAPSIVDVDAEVVFRHPLAIVLLVTFVVGALDAVGFQQFGVFTANQAGNMVIVWTLLAATPAAAGLALASLVGCALGVTTVILVRRAWSWLVTATGSRTMLAAAAVLIFVAQRLGTRLSTTTTTTTTTDATPDLWTSGWWAEAASISLIAFSIAVLGMVFVSGGGVRAPILASTNAFVDAIRYAVAGAVAPQARPQWWRHARISMGFPLAWTAGAAAASLLPIGPLGIVVSSTVIVLGIALLARRVSGADPVTRPTV